jgi:peptidyl-prolyl cis-trans isomerase D
MFDAVRNNKIITQTILGLIAITFAFFGLESYVRDPGAAGDVATIGELKVNQQQFQEALREQQDRLRAQLGEQYDAKLLEAPEARKAILDDLINQRLLMLEANKHRMFVSDEAIRQTILGIQAFNVDGRFSNERYEAALRAQGMTPAGFEAQLRQDLTLQQLAGSVARSTINANASVNRILALQTEKRDVSEVRISLDSHLDKVKLADDAARKYYDENSKQFQLPEQAVAEYVVLSMDAISDQLAVSDAEIQAWYEGHRNQFEQPEERRASHILVASEKLGIDKARLKADELLTEIRKNPGRFAELASKNSDDPGSASKGGDLGYFGRGMMVKPFEDTAFSLGEGEISGVVESDFGFHIIKLSGIRAAKLKPLAEVRSQIEAELKKTAASRKFAEAAEAFSNTVYEQADSLAPVAETYKLKINRSAWLERQPNPANGPLANQKLLASLFAEDSIKNRRNTEAVEVATNTLVAARIVDYRPATLQEFAGLKASIETLLRRQEAQTLARQDGEARLAALKNGEDRQSWGAGKLVSRLDARLLPPPAVPVVFRMDSQKLPAYAGVELPGAGYALFRLNNVDAGAALDEASRKALQGQLDNFSAQEELRLYLAALRSRYKVEINQAALENK